MYFKLFKIQKWLSNETDEVLNMILIGQEYYISLGVEKIVCASQGSNGKSIYGRVMIIFNILSEKHTLLRKKGFKKLRDTVLDTQINCVYLRILTCRLRLRKEKIGNLAYFQSYSPSK